MDKSRKLLYSGLLLFAFFPLIPNNLKGLPVIILFLIAIYLFYKRRRHKFDYKKVFYFSSLYLLYIFSLLFTEDFNGVDKILTTRLSLFIVPLSFGLIATAIGKVSQKQVNSFLKVYVGATIIYCLLVILFIYQLGFFSDAIKINSVYAYISNEMYSINQHPIYASMLISFAFIFGVNLLLVEKKTKAKYLIFIGLVPMIYVLFFLSRKSILLALVLVVLIILLSFKSLNYKKISIGIILVFGVLVIILPTVKNRFSELLNPTSYSKIQEKNSSSIRFGIYNCSINKIKENLIFGYGIGDVKNELRKCYAETSSVLLKENYNSHNQYLSFFLSNGIVGFIVLLLFLYLNLMKAIKQQNLLYLSLLVFYSIVMLFENILERQSGVILFSLFINFFAFINIDKKGIEQSISDDL